MVIATEGAVNISQSASFLIPVIGCRHLSAMFDFPWHTYLRRPRQCPCRVSIETLEMKTILTSNREPRLQFDYVGMMTGVDLYMVIRFD